jgi:hypothetical protein
MGESHESHRHRGIHPVPIVVSGLKSDPGEREKNLFPRRAAGSAGASATARHVLAVKICENLSQDHV